ncbi:hypothetical protein FRB93_013701 [Tulasnella sp. JGI-2019a]|nr:hypothetical protein FRB93_013701 [Tulasnella sp. JGI-2019a]
MVSFRSLLHLACAAAVGVSAIHGNNNELVPRSVAPSSTGTVGGYYYYYSADAGSTANFTNNGNGEYTLVWSGSGTVIGGIGWNPGSARVIVYSGSWTANGNAFLCVYGWTTNPLIEYYIVENFGTYNPSTGATLRGSVTTDGSTYNIYLTVRTNKPSIQGTATFNQYWSVRTSKRTGGTVTTANHFNAWAALGMPLGTFNYQIVATEVSNGSGSANITVGGDPNFGTTTTLAKRSSCALHYAQCDGIGYTGPTCCVSGTTCTYSSASYSRCL